MKPPVPLQVKNTEESSSEEPNSSDDEPKSKVVSLAQLLTKTKEAGIDSSFLDLLYSLLYVFSAMCNREDFSKYKQ